MSDRIKEIEERYCAKLINMELAINMLTKNKGYTPDFDFDLVLPEHTITYNYRLHFYKPEKDRDLFDDIVDKINQFRTNRITEGMVCVYYFEDETYRTVYVSIEDINCLKINRSELIKHE